MATQYQTYKLGNFKLKSGGEIPDAFIAYTTLGEPSLPTVIYPTWYSGLISDNLWLIGPGKTLDPQNYYIIIPALFGNGQSSSPSNMPNLRPFPDVLFYDNVRAQHELVTKHLGITHARAVLGWSMGAGQTYQWATQFPDFMDFIAPFCGSARTSEHNKVMLEGVKSALYAAKGTVSGGVAMPDIRTAQDGYSPFLGEKKEIALKALGRVYAGWGFSQAFYREKLYETVLGFKSLDSFLVGFWEKWACSKDPENMIVMAHTWQTGDCSQQEPYNGDFKEAMHAIKARALVMPSHTDLYFPPEDSQIEIDGMRPGVGSLKVFPSIWGHWAAGPGGSPDDVKWLDDNLRTFLTESNSSC
ncbi:homoserine acetyltransferase family protein [Sporormia fimetaria CBS 119925]|uniref:Homoserine acetyltransferase family protein n=1 Tax=Sporormia fimetaria CBS 119925 TaxID=1340428 RepID=A0A6A6VFL0_9PLEO|nr:homoserine acetyltransferase family protein [Sporormia fimetaria CBS 119925]